MKTSLLVIGGGAAGLIAAGTAANEGVETIILERNERPARKVMITGKGRCNVTNNCSSLQELIQNVPRNGRFFFYYASVARSKGIFAIYVLSQKCKITIFRFVYPC